MSGFLSAVWNSVIEYETPRLVKIHNRKVGLVRRLIQLGIIMYVAIYALWLQKGYQEFGRVRSSVTTKIKGVTKSQLDPDSPFDEALYSRIWDVADYVIPPAENGAFFVATNVIITPNQTRGTCPEDHTDVKNVNCVPNLDECQREQETTTTTTSLPPTTETSTLISPSSPVPYDENSREKRSLGKIVRCRPINDTCHKGAVIFKAHGPLTGYCVPSDRPGVHSSIFSCEVESWCPIEIDRLPLGKRRALMFRAENYTVFVKNSIAFPYFGDEYMRNNLISNGGRPCLFYRDGKIDEGCQIFKLGDMVRFAGGNFSEMAVKGGVVSLSIAWHCNLDHDFMSTCLPSYSFRILDDFGWNFRHAKYHEENRRTLYKMYGIKFIITIEGRGGKFNLKNTILNVGSGLALLGVTTVVCDFLLMYIKERRMIKQKKYDYVEIVKPPKLETPADVPRSNNNLGVPQQQQTEQQQGSSNNRRGRLKLKLSPNLKTKNGSKTAEEEEMMPQQQEKQEEEQESNTRLPRDLTTLTTLSASVSSPEQQTAASPSLKAPAAKPEHIELI